MSGGETSDVDAGLLWRVGVGDEDETTAKVIHVDATHALASDVEGGLGGIREEGELRHHLELFDAVVEGDKQGEVYDGVTAGNGVVLDVVVESAAVGRRDDEVVVLVLVSVDGGVGDEDLVGRIDGEVEDIDGVAAVGRDKAVIVGTFGDELAIVPSVRDVFAGLGVSFEEIGGQNCEDEVDNAVAAAFIGEDDLVVEGAGLCREGVETVDLVSFALADGVVDALYIRRVDGEVEFEDVKTSGGVGQGVGVVTGGRE